MKRKLLSVILSAAMVVTMLTGCGEENVESSATPTSAPTATEAPTAAPTAEPTAAPTAEPTVVAEPIPDPVYYFSFDDATGLSPRANVNDSTLTTVDERVYVVDEEFAFTNGVKGNCLWLDGSFGAKVETIKPVNSDTYTISFWTWASRLSNYGTTLQFGNGMAVGDTEHWLSFTTLDNTSTYPLIWNRDASTGTWPAPVYEDGAIYGRKKWAHFCLVVDETNVIDLNGAMVLNADLYIDGVPSANDIQVVPGIFTEAETEFAFLIGVNPWDTIFKGAIDELYVFDKALTAGQVATLYADGDGTTTPELSTIPEPEVIRDYTALAATGTVVGALDGSTTYGTAYSDIVEVPTGQTVDFTFKTYVPSKLNEAGKNTYDFSDTFSVILQNVAAGHSTADDAAYKEYAVISGSEGYEVAAGLSDLKIERSTFDQFNPEKFITAMDQATVYVSVTNNGTTATVNIKGVCADTISRYVDVIDIPVDGPVYATLTVDECIIDIQENMVSTGLVLGSTDCTTPFWTVHSDTTKVEVGETKTVNFKNYTNGAANWNNFLVVLQTVADAHAADDTNGYAEYAVLRADNFGWGDGYATATLESNWNWDTFTKDINGADVQLSVTNNGTTADVVAVVTTKDGTVYTQKYAGITITGELHFCLTVEGGWLDIQGTVLGNTDCTTPFWTVHSATKKVEVGESVTSHFRNFTNGAANWNNFLVVLQTVADAHAADDTNGYAEYAVLRADNFGWGDGYATATLECDWNWDTYAKDMNGADVVVTVTNNGATADVVAVVTTMDGVVYTQKYTGITITGDLHYCLTCEGAWLNIYE